MIPYEEAYEEGFEDMHRRVPEISKIGEMIGWGPTHALDDIIADVAERAPSNGCSLTTIALQRSVKSG